MSKREIIDKKAKANKELKEVSEMRSIIENYETASARSYKMIATVQDYSNSCSTTSVSTTVAPLQASYATLNTPPGIGTKNAFDTFTLGASEI